MGHLLIVSNRGPFSFSEEFLREAETTLKEGIHPHPPKFGEGGLVQAMSGLLKPGKWKTTWLGASMGDRDIDVARGHYRKLFRAMKRGGYAPRYFPLIEIDPDNRMHFVYQSYDFYMRFVYFDIRHMHSYYDRFANGFLWPLMHLTRSPLFYKKTSTFPRPKFEKNDFVQYISSGVTFANTIIDEVRKTGEDGNGNQEIVIWNQDYHLMRIAEVHKTLLEEEGMSREAKKKIHVGQFIHTPFFNIHEIQGLIREDKRKRVRERIYDPFVESIETTLQKLTWGLLSNDFIGFHTKEYCDHYLEALQEWFPVEIRMLGEFYEIVHQDSVTTIGAHPIGLDVDKILSEVVDEKRLDYRFHGKDLGESIRNDKARGKIVFGGLERCDYTKGLVERLGIFNQVANRLRGMQEEARFYQATAPSRSNNPEYRNLQEVFKSEVLKANKRLGEEAVVFLEEGVPTPENYRFMKEVDVMMVTPLEDGMNLVALEYILSQRFKKPGERGLLLLSTSGASRVLKSKGFGEEDGIVHITNPMNEKDAAEKVVESLKRRLHISDRLINHVAEERRVDHWAEKNIDAILNCRKQP